MLFKQEKKLSDVYGQDVLIERQCQNWFVKFWSGNFANEDASRKAEEDTIKLLIKANWQITIREIAERLNLSNLTVHDHLKLSTLKISTYGFLIFLRKNRSFRIDVYGLLLKRQENDSFLKRAITGAEK